MQEAHTSVGPRHLGLSDDLAMALQSWADWHDEHQHATDAGDWRRWTEAGATLAERLAGETGAEVVYSRADGHAMATDCPQCRVR